MKERKTRLPVMYSPTIYPDSGLVSSHILDPEKNKARARHACQRLQMPNDPPSSPSITVIWAAVLVVRHPRLQAVICSTKIGLYKANFSQITVFPSPAWKLSICFNRYWYRTSIVPLCTLVHTNRGPTPRNRPGTPSVLYMSFRPVSTEDVSSVGVECGTVRGPEWISRV